MAKGNSFSVHIKVLVGGLRVSINMSLYTSSPNWIRRIPDHLKTREVCDETVRIKSYSLNFIPTHLKTREICNEVMHIIPVTFLVISDYFKTQEMCIRALEEDPWDLIYLLDHFKT